jgi:HPr kinase/phosphorylase
VRVPQVLLPVSPGRNLATLVETALRVHLLRVRGYNAARDFVARHAALLAGDAKGGDAADAAALSPSRERIDDEQKEA